jgi:hypothetical protein
MRRFFKSLCPVRSYLEQYPRLLIVMIRTLTVVVLYLIGSDTRVHSLDLLHIGGAAYFVWAGLPNFG